MTTVNTKITYDAANNDPAQLDMSQWHRDDPNLPPTAIEARDALTRQGLVSALANSRDTSHTVPMMKDITLGRSV